MLAGAVFPDPLTRVAVAPDVPFAPKVKTRPGSFILKQGWVGRLLAFEDAIDEILINLKTAAGLGLTLPAVTGLSLQSTDAAGKRLELLREVVPNLRRLAVMVNVGNPQAVLEMNEVQAMAHALGLEPAMFGFKQVADIAPAFDALKGRADALYDCTDAFVNTNRIRINTLALVGRLPTIYNSREIVEAGGLMSFGPSFPDLFRRAGDYVDKILRRATPADLPVEQPTKFDLAINLVTAKALGLNLPATLLARADLVIE
jgi:putative ABC transport system substrate-binding protein